MSCSSTWYSVFLFLMLHQSWIFLLNGSWETTMYVVHVEHLRLRGQTLVSNPCRHGTYAEAILNQCDSFRSEPILNVSWTNLTRHFDQTSFILPIVVWIILISWRGQWEVFSNKFQVHLINPLGECVHMVHSPILSEHCHYSSQKHNVWLNWLPERRSLMLTTHGLILFLMSKTSRLKSFFAVYLVFSNIVSVNKEMQ